MPLANNIENPQLQIMPESVLWEEFHHNFLRHGSSFAKLEDWTKTSLFELHSRLLSNDKYLNYLETLSTDEMTNHNLVSPIFKSKTLSVNLIAIEPGFDLPLHDHPNTSGAMMVISGNVHCLACEHVEAANNSHQSKALLKIAGNKHFQSNESNCFTPSKNNIHSFEALTERAILMVIHTPPTQDGHQSYFFAHTSKQNVGSEFLAQRIPAQPAKKEK